MHKNLEIISSNKCMQNVLVPTIKLPFFINESLVFKVCGLQFVGNNDF